MECQRRLEEKLKSKQPQSKFKYSSKQDIGLRPTPEDQDVGNTTPRSAAKANPVSQLNFLSERSTQIFESSKYQSLFDQLSVQDATDFIKNIK